MKKAFGIALFVLSFAVLSACSNNQPAAKQDNASTVNQPAAKQDNATTVNQPAAKQDNASAVNQPAAKEDKASTSNQPAVKEDKAPTSNQPVVKEDKASTVSGNEVFQKSCIACHSTGDITGGKLKIDSAKVHTDFKTQDDLLAFVSTKMPKKAPGSLSQEDYNAVVQYLWDQK